MSCRCTGYSVRDTVGQTVTSVVGDDTGGSPFEAALRALGPVSLYRFHDANFATNIQDYSGNGNHLVKQNATAARSSVPTRTTHPGGAYFPSVTYDNWGTQGTEYKAAADSVLSGTTAYTIVMSCRILREPSDHDAKAFAIGTEDAAETGANDLVVFKVDSNAPTNPSYFKHRSSSGGLIPVDFAQTETLEDGVSRLITVRYAYNDIFRMVTSRPGHSALTEESVDASSGSGLASISRAILLNARTETATGSSTTLGMVVDALAIFNSDIGAAAESDLHSKWSDEVAGAGYYPSMMQYDGSTGYYSRAYTSSGNKVSVVLRFNRSSFTGDAVETVMRTDGPTGHRRAQVILLSSDNTAAPNQADCIQVQSRNSAGTQICKLISPASTYLDGEDHVLFYAFDGDNGTAVFRIDGVDVDDTGNADRIAPTTGTLDSGASTDLHVGDSTAGGTVLDGSVGFFGYRDAYLTNYTDFINSTDNSLPAVIDEKNWSQWDGRNAGDPGMTEFATNGAYERNNDITTSGSAITVVARFKQDSFTGGGLRQLCRCNGATQIRVHIVARANDHADSNIQDRFTIRVRNSAGSNICYLVSESGYLDGQEHVLFFSFDGATGAATFKIDGVDADDSDNASRVAPTTGTLESGSGSDMYVSDSLSPWLNDIGFFGLREAYLTNYSDFSTGSTPADIDEVDWTEWGAQPLFWNRTGEMSDNKGSAGNMTANGTINPPRPLFWSHTGQMDNNKGSAGDMTANGTITMTEGGSP